MGLILLMFIFKKVSSLNSETRKEEERSICGSYKMYLRSIASAISTVFGLFSVLADNAYRRHLFVLKGWLWIKTLYLLSHTRRQWIYKALWILCGLHLYDLNPFCSIFTIYLKLHFKALNLGPLTFCAAVSIGSVNTPVGIACSTLTPLRIWTSVNSIYFISFSIANFFIQKTYLCYN